MTPILFPGVQHVPFYKMLIVAYKYVTQSKCINNKETKLEHRQTTRSTIQFRDRSQ